MAMNPQQRQALIEAALAAREKAYAPYSKFHVGAAVLAASGRIFSGCNVENASYGLTICAERVALVGAVAGGDTQFVAMALVTVGAASPCGACRQFASEFRHDLPILIIDADAPQKIRETSLDHLLPDQFSLRDGG
jgi:cytidine deaminase